MKGLIEREILGANWSTVLGANLVGALPHQVMRCPAASLGVHDLAQSRTHLAQRVRDNTARALMPLRLLKYWFWLMQRAP
jgi:hypothetical protein